MTQPEVSKHWRKPVGNQDKACILSETHHQWEVGKVVTRHCYFCILFISSSVHTIICVRKMYLSAEGVLVCWNYYVGIWTCPQIFKYLCPSNICVHVIWPEIGFQVKLMPSSVTFFHSLSILVSLCLVVFVLLCWAIKITKLTVFWKHNWFSTSLIIKLYM